MEQTMECLLAKTDTNQVVMLTRMMAKTDSQLGKMEDSLGRTEAMDLEANPEEI
ncbi:hypothetical protein B7P43_G12044 [Cryptotermes secundus]|uniref:Uncharacterized protein n=1 Tax=Cryptotermes secundus TaxID=105785 RepID=A0A2J7Q8F4_9NEOP|nr:hypothetical protein B7P43_G12044 [Cryptotermes secundus]